MTLDTREGIRSRNDQIRVDAAAKSVIIKQIMSTGDGRKWIADFLEACHVNAPCFDRDAQVMSFLLGERNVGLRLLAEVTTACPDEYVSMLKEIGEKNGRRDERDTGGGNASADNPTGEPAERSGGDDTSG